MLAFLTSLKKTSKSLWIFQQGKALLQAWFLALTMLFWRNYRVQGHSCQRIKIATIVYFLFIQKLLTNLNVLALHYGGSFFLFVCFSRNDFFSDQWATFTFERLVKWIDLLINSLFNNESRIKMLDREIVKWQKELLYFYRCDNHFHNYFLFTLVNHLVQRREKSASYWRKIHNETRQDLANSSFT